MIENLTIKLMVVKITIQPNKIGITESSLIIKNVGPANDKE